MTTDNSQVAKKPPEDEERKPIRFKREPGEDDEDEEVDLTPMVDVTFLLLIFFMITAAFALQKTIEVPPQSEEQSATTVTVDDLEEDAIVVRIDGDNVYWVGCPNWPEERRAASKQDMRTAVKEARTGAGGASGFSKLLVKVSGDALHEFVVAALDSGSANSVEEIQLMMVDDDEFY